jgi:hypothetical protein
MLSRHLKAPAKRHWVAVEGVFRYLKGSADQAIVYKRGGRGLEGWSDSDWATYKANRRSQSGYGFTFNGAILTWRSALQPNVAHSSTEAEYTAADEATRELRWLQKFFGELGLTRVLRTGKIKLWQDNRGAMKLATNPVFHRRTKHIAVRYHYIREVLQDGLMELDWVDTRNMLADCLTKPVVGRQFEMCNRNMSLKMPNV